MATQNIYNLTDEWNDAGIAFSAIKMNVTDTASKAQSLLMDLQVGGVSRLNVLKTGEITLPQSGGVNLVAGSGLFRFTTGGGSDRAGIGSDAGTHTLKLLVGAGALAATIITDGIALGSSADAILIRDAADTLAQRNGTNAQEQRWWNTFTDLSNGEYGYASWKETANVFEIGTKALGTGTPRPLSFPGTDIRMANLPTTDPTVAGQLWSNSGVVTVSAG